MQKTIFPMPRLAHQIRKYSYTLMNVLCDNCGTCMIYMYVLIQTLVEQCPADDPDTEFNMGCVLFKVHVHCTCTLLLCSDFCNMKFMSLWAHTLYIVYMHMYVMQEKRYEEATAKFNTVLQVMGYRAGTCTYTQSPYWLNSSTYMYTYLQPIPTCMLVIFSLSTRHLLLSGTVSLHDEAVRSLSQVHLRRDRERHQGPPWAQCWHADRGSRHT